MRKKFTITVIGIVLCLAMLIAGCGTGGGNSGATTAGAATDAATTAAATTAAATAAATDAATTAAAAKDITSYDDPDISWKQVKDTPVTIGCYIDFDWYALDTWGKDEVSQEITRRTGVSLDVTKSSDLNQLSVLFAADQLPEMMFTTNMVERFYDTDFVWPFNELIDQYCPEWMNLLDPVEIVNNTQPDGNFYTLRSHYNSAEAWADPRNVSSPGDSFFAYREDIAKELGIPEITSIEEMMDAFAVVKEQRPDMIVYAPQSQWANPLTWFMHTWEGVGAVVTDGVVSLAYDCPRAYEWLQLLNEMVRLGYVDTEFYTYQTQQWEEIINQGNTFAASYNSGVADRANKYYDENGMSGKWFIHPKKPFTYKGEMLFQPIDGGIGWSNLFITKNCKNPDRAIQYMEFLKSPEGDQLTQWGIEGKHYTLSEEGYILRPEGFEKLLGTDTGIGPWYFMASGLGEGVAVTSGKVGPTPQYTQGVDALMMYKPYYFRDPAMAFMAPKPETDEFNIRTKLNDLYTNVKMELYGAPSEADLKAVYEKFCADAETIGAKQLLAYYQQAYDTAKARYQ